MMVAAQAIRLNQNDQEVSFIQAASEIAAREGSGVRARWVELPDCSEIGWRNVTEGDGTLIPLKEDLSNAIIATCKHFNWTAGGTPYSYMPPDPYAEGD